MEFKIELGKETDIDELENLYNDINDYLASAINYSGWKKGVYPVRETAINGVAEQSLYVARIGGRIAGTIILNNRPEAAYAGAKWAFESDYRDVFVIHTFVVHPDFLKCGVGEKLLRFSFDLGVECKKKAVRLDVYEKNMPAMKLYEKCGFKYVDTVDLGLGEYGLDWFRLYEKLL